MVSHPTLILGAGRIGGQVPDFLAQRREYGLRPVGFLDEHPLLRPSDCDVPVIGKQADLASAIKKHGIQDVIVASSNIRESAMVDVIRTCDRLDCEIFFVPRLFELGSALRDSDHVWGVPLVRLQRATIRTFPWRLKRLFDIAFASVLLLLVAPVMARPSARSPSGWTRVRACYSARNAWGSTVNRSCSSSSDHCVRPRRTSRRPAGQSL
jgi:hypothetical protein